MDKYPLIGVSIIAVILLILGSLTNVVGYETVQSSAPIVEQNQVNNQLEQKHVTQDSNSECDCEKINRVTGWHFPVICSILFIPYSIGIFFYDIAAAFHMFRLVNILVKILSPFYQIGKTLNCFWVDAQYFDDLQKIILR
jgi:hypothetical protein